MKTNRTAVSGNFACSFPLCSSTFSERDSDLKKGGNFIARLDIRNIPDETFHLLEQLAKEKGQTRTDFLREQILLIAKHKKWQEEVKTIESDFFKQIIETLEKNNQLLESFIKKF